ncbi:hypothetical protein Tco_0505527 [Tanacetum coccineum]
MDNHVESCLQQMKVKSTMIKDAKSDSNLGNPQIDRSNYGGSVLVFSGSIGLKRLLLRATLKTAPSFTVDLTKHHTSSLTAENQISPFYMYSGLSVIPRMIVKILGSLVQKVILAFSLAILLIPVLTEFTTEGQRKSWRQ